MPDASGRGDETTSVLFLDLRNSTLFIDNYDEEVVAETLDLLFTKARERIRAAGGEVDKLIGDGCMAVFDGPDSERGAVRAALDVYGEAVPETEHEQGFNTLDVGIGVATGPVNETTLAGIDSTVIGRPVNVAARLQALCKEYDLWLLVDRATREGIDEAVLPDDYAMRRIPGRDLNGIRNKVDTYNVCDTGRLAESYIETFNRGVERYLSGEFDDALTEFTAAYTRHERYADQALLNQFTNECLERLESGQELFRNPERYERHSDTQERQSYQLQGPILQETRDWEDRPQWILDVGCGTGKVTERLLKGMFSDSRIVGVDASQQSVAKARTDHTGSDPEITYEQARIERYAPTEEHDRYDLIFSNSAMHWIDEQDRAYANLRKLIDDDGLLAVHQGAEGTYHELHQVVVDLIDRLGWRHHFDDLNPPLDLTYHDEAEMEALLNRNGFAVSQLRVAEESAPDTIVEDFAEASLNAYCDRLESDSQRDVFREEFTRLASERLRPSDVTVRRIYLTARPVAQ